MFYTYILFCKNKENKGEFYVGFTANLDKRLKDHKSGSVQTTQKFVSIELIYFEACKNETDARKRELQLKTGFGRGYIKKRLENYLKKQV